MVNTSGGEVACDERSGHVGDFGLTTILVWW